MGRGRGREPHQPCRRGQRASLLAEQSEHGQARRRGDGPSDDNHLLHVQRFALHRNFREVLRWLRGGGLAAVLFRRPRLRRPRPCLTLTCGWCRHPAPACFRKMRKHRPSGRVTWSGRATRATTVSGRTNGTILFSRTACDLCDLCDFLRSVNHERPAHPPDRDRDQIERESRKAAICGGRLHRARARGQSSVRQDSLQIEHTVGYGFGDR